MDEMTNEDETKLEVVDFGDAMVETKQPAQIPIIQDSCCTWGYFGLD